MLYDIRKKMPKIKCIKTFNNFLPKEHLEHNNIDCNGDSGLYYDMFQNGKTYRCSKPMETINNEYIVAVYSKIKHKIGKPNYPIFIHEIFKIGDINHERRFEDYFDIEYIMEFKFASNRIREALNINVVNMNNHEPTEYDYYIGRPSPLSNPFTHKNNTKFAKFVVNTRDEAIELYNSYFDKNLKTEEFQDAINEILEMHKKYKKVNLVCFCKPKSCHGDYIKHKIENILLGI